MKEQPVIQPLHACRDISLIGAKALQLGRLLRADLPVPPGFVVTTAAFHRARAESTDSTASARLTPDLAKAIKTAYRQLAAPLVAVRSSATAEDMDDASMAGLYETFLSIEGDSALLAAIEKCWASLATSRAQAYLREQALDPAQVAMAVVIQQLIPAQVAGVLFTVNPQPGLSRQMVVEASWGLGETVVSGLVQPDRFCLDRDTGQVLEATIADKQLYLTADQPQPRPVDESRRGQACLRSREVFELWKLARRVVDMYDKPMDLEWALCDKVFYLLQARPITTLVHLKAREKIVVETQQRLRQAAAAGRGPWVLHNLAETLVHPTALSWSVMQRYMSGSGGFGLMYQQAGFSPSAQIEQQGFLDLIAGRIYMDVSRAPEMLFEDFPWAYDLQQLKRSPDASQQAPTVPRGSFLCRCRAGRKLKTVHNRLMSLMNTLEPELRGSLFPQMIEYVKQSRAVDLDTLSGERWVECWQAHEKQVLETFGPRLLLPGLLSALALDQFQTFLQETLWDRDIDSLTQWACSGGPLDQSVLLHAELYEVAQGKRPLETWLAEHGHRGTGEMDLAEARWRELPEAVQEMADQLKSGEAPQKRHCRHSADVDQQLAGLRRHLSRSRRRQFDQLLRRVRRVQALREDSKDSWLRGYDLLRDMALAAGQRLDIGEDVFYLTRKELFACLRVGFAPYSIIEQRKQSYQAESQLRPACFLDLESIETLGDPPDMDPVAGGQRAIPVSAGEASGPVRIMLSPAYADDLEPGSILVCPSTDPSWTPLFMKAGALVFECGGMLSHGAVLARELGLPAVVLSNATTVLHEGEQLRVDGLHGWVGPVANAKDPLSKLGGPQTKRLVPPSPNTREKQILRLSLSLGAVWTLFLLAFFLLPRQWVYAPTFTVLDRLFWPLVRSWGRPAPVVMLATLVALISLLVQKFTIDQRRLHLVKQQATRFRKQLASASEEGATRDTATAYIAHVQTYSLLAALIPVGLLLGPMMLPLVWCHARVDPAVKSALVGADVQVVAMVDGDWTGPVQIEVPDGIRVDASTALCRSLPPLRQTLEHLLMLYRQDRTETLEAWELTYAPDPGRDLAAQDLQAYLDAGIPAQGIQWLLKTPLSLNGRFPVTVTAEGQAPVSLQVVLGDSYAPGPTRRLGPLGSPIRELRIVYPRPKQKPVFWQPFSWLDSGMSIPWRTRLAAWDIGWLWLYLMVYLPALMIIRMVLRIA